MEGTVCERKPIGLASLTGFALQRAIREAAALN